MPLLKEFGDPFVEIEETQAVYWKTKLRKNTSKYYVYDFLVDDFNWIEITEPFEDGDLLVVVERYDAAKVPNYKHLQLHTGCNMLFELLVFGRKTLVIKPCIIQQIEKLGALTLWMTCYSGSPRLRLHSLDIPLS